MQDGAQYAATFESAANAAAAASLGRPSLGIGVPIVSGAGFYPAFRAFGGVIARLRGVHRQRRDYGHAAEWDG